MSIIPEGEDLRKAVQWISEKREKHLSEALADIIDSACLQFDLSPNDAEFLLRHIKKNESVDNDK
ncbi:MAG: hypothetical protein HQK77_02680 [Desulfobacterales bacterium]|nr:hypothetical protein [Desulfobacterales bacterium]